MNTLPTTRTSAALRVAVPLACALVAGCTVPNVPRESDRPVPVTAPLAGTQWRLVEIQSRDDRRGAARPDERSKYTMQLNRDGSVTMQINCNRATGTWRVEPAADSLSGRFEFGPLAATLALCPPPSLDERLTVQAPYVRGYLLKDGQLNLSLIADGGIQVWEPADIEVPFLTAADLALEAAILEAAPSYTRQVVEPLGAAGRARYVYTRVDLNGDGRPEVLVFLTGGIFCGTGGCNLMLFTDRGQRYELVNDFPISRPPVIVSPHRTQGWNDLVRIESGGGGQATYLRHVFDGQRYVAADRAPIGEVQPEGRRMLAGELGPRVGAPLEPRK